MFKVPLKCAKVRKNVEQSRRPSIAVEKALWFLQNKVTENADDNDWFGVSQQF